MSFPFVDIVFKEPSIFSIIFLAKKLDRLRASNLKIIR